MRAAHHGSGQSPNAAILLVTALGACGVAPQQDSIWPPADFEVSVEEQIVDGASRRVIRRCRVRADGTVFFATSSASIGDAATALLPVFERTCIYRLVPMCTRALARRIHRAGVLDLDLVQGERNVPNAAAATLYWRAFGERRVVQASGRVHGAMAEIVAIVGAHLPDGERFELPGVAERAIGPVLRGVPRPVDDPVAALAALRRLHAEAPGDSTLLLDAFALACHLGQREPAERLLEAWSALTAAGRREHEVFPEGEVRLAPDLLRRLLPPPKPAP